MAKCLFLTSTSCFSNNVKSISDVSIYLFQLFIFLFLFPLFSWQPYYNHYYFIYMLMMTWNRELVFVFYNVIWFYTIVFFRQINGKALTVNTEKILSFYVVLFYFFLRFIPTKNSYFSCRMFNLVKCR